MTLTPEIEKQLLDLIKNAEEAWADWQRAKHRHSSFTTHIKNILKRLQKAEDIKKDENGD
jgi:uncharacterized coiled-coil DUF342 family protein